MADALSSDFLQIMALAAPTPHLVQTALGDTIWSRPAESENSFVMKGLKRVRSLYGVDAESGLVSIEPSSGAKDKDHECSAVLRTAVGCTKTVSRF
jgi:hypothetical protein